MGISERNEPQRWPPCGNPWSRSLPYAYLHRSSFGHLSNQNMLMSDAPVQDRPQLGRRSLPVSVRSQKPEVTTGTTFSHHTATGPHLTVQVNKKKSTDLWIFTPYPDPVGFQRRSGIERIPGPRGPIRVKISGSTIALLDKY